jgi:chromate transporter
MAAPSLSEAAATREAPAPRPSFAEATRVWLRIGLIGFGGPSAQIALMHRLLVDERRWIGEAQFLHALNFCMLLPGPEAQQLATTSAGCCTGREAASSPAACSCCPASPSS